jgi:hypothetical protein
MSKDLHEKFLLVRYNIIYVVWYGEGEISDVEKIMSSFVGQKLRKENTDDVHRSKMTFALTCPP